jgi:hypothetical protein
MEKRKALFAVSIIIIAAIATFYFNIAGGKEGSEISTNSAVLKTSSADYAEYGKQTCERFVFYGFPYGICCCFT